MGQSYTRAEMQGPRLCLQRGAGMGSGGSPLLTTETETPSPGGGQRSPGTSTLPLCLWGRLPCVFQFPLHLPGSSAQPPRPTPTAKLATPLREIEGESMETLGGYMGLKYLIKFPRDWSHHFLLSHSLLLGSSANSRENENKDFQPNKNLCSNPPTPRACH